MRKQFLDPVEWGWKITKKLCQITKTTSLEHFQQQQKLLTSITRRENKDINCKFSIVLKTKDMEENIQHY